MLVNMFVSLWMVAGEYVCVSLDGFTWVCLNWIGASRIHQGRRLTVPLDIVCSPVARASQPMM